MFSSLFPFLICFLFLVLFSENRHLRQSLKTPKPALKQANPSLENETKKIEKRSKPALESPNPHLSEALGELCLK